MVHLLAVDQSVLLMETGNDITQGDVSHIHFSLSFRVASQIHLTLPLCKLEQ